MSNNVIDRFDGENRFLSNFYPSVVIYEGIAYPSVENAYQAAKTLNETERLAFINLTPGQAKRKGARVDLRPDWEAIKLDVMFDLLCQKFQNPFLESALIATYPKELIEGNNWGDVFWGAVDGKGRNILGLMLMNIRAKLMKEET
jgi:ribA/ribD-fused uncharacterized protein